MSMIDYSSDHSDCIILVLAVRYLMVLKSFDNLFSAFDDILDTKNKDITITIC